MKHLSISFILLFFACSDRNAKAVDLSTFDALSCFIDSSHIYFAEAGMDSSLLPYTNWHRSGTAPLVRMFGIEMKPKVKHEIVVHGFEFVDTSSDTILLTAGRLFGLWDTRTPELPAHISRYLREHTIRNHLYIVRAEMKASDSAYFSVFSNTLVDVLHSQTKEAAVQKMYEARDLIANLNGR